MGNDIAGMYKKFEREKGGNIWKKSQNVLTRSFSSFNGCYGPPNRSIFTFGIAPAAIKPILTFKKQFQSKQVIRIDSKKGVIKMKTLQKFGGFAALIGAATNLLALVVFLAILAPTGYGSDDPGQVVAFLADNQAFIRVWYLIIYLLFGVSMIFLALALNERLKAGSPALAQAVITLGLIWAVLIIVNGTLSINNVSTVVKLYGENPAQAATVWLTLDSVETGLGANGGETMVSALWLLLLGWVTLRAKELPRVLNYLGVVIGIAGILSVVLEPALAAVYGLGLIIWFVWLGIVLLRSNPGKTA
jgi:hypothetical protein